MTAPVDWAESEPDAVGVAPEGLAAALELVGARGATAQLCVLRGGRVVLDRSFGCTPDSLFWIFSASKPYVAVLVHQLADRGLLDLDDPVARHWPEFGHAGKAAITVRQVLTHRTGLPTTGNFLADAVAMTDWRLSVRRIERARPHWEPGSVPAYSPLVYGFLLGELVARVTGRPLVECLRTDLLDPIGVTDTHLGLADEHWPRHVPLRVERGMPGQVVTTALNTRRWRRAVVPAAGISTTARDVATFYRHLLAAAAGVAPGLLSAAAMARALVPDTDGETDRTSGVAIRWAAGFQLGGPRTGPGGASPMGASSSPRAFGHNGSNCCIAWADPDRDLVYAYLTNRITDRSLDRRHQVAVADAVLSACGEPAEPVLGPAS